MQMPGGRIFLLLMKLPDLLDIPKKHLEQRSEALLTVRCILVSSLGHCYFKIKYFYMKGALAVCWQPSQ